MTWQVRRTARIQRKYVKAMQFHPIIVRLSYVNSAASDVSTYPAVLQTLVTPFWTNMSPIHSAEMRRGRQNTSVAAVDDARKRHRWSGPRSRIAPAVQRRTALLNNRVQLLRLVLAGHFSAPDVHLFVVNKRSFCCLLCAHVSTPLRVLLFFFVFLLQKLVAKAGLPIINKIPTIMKSNINLASYLVEDIFGSVRDISKNVVAHYYVAGTAQVSRICPSNPVE